MNDILPRIRAVCTDKKLKQGQLRAPPGFCFRKGVRAGFAAAMRRNQNQNQNQPQPQAENRIPLAPVVDLFAEQQARQQLNQNLQEQRTATTERTRQRLEQRRMAREDVNVVAPRVKPAGRRKKFREFYGLDVPALPVRPAPRTTAPRRRPIQAQPVPSLKTLFDAYKVGKAKPRLRDMLLGLRFVNPAYNRLTTAQKKAMTPTELKAWAIRSGEYRA